MITNLFVNVHGPGLRGFGPFDGPPSYDVRTFDDVWIDDQGTLIISVAQHVTTKGVMVNKVVRYPKGSWTHAEYVTTTVPKDGDA